MVHNNLHSERDQGDSSGDSLRESTVLSGSQGGQERVPNTAQRQDGLLACPECAEQQVNSRVYTIAEHDLRNSYVVELACVEGHEWREEI